MLKILLKKAFTKKNISKIALIFFIGFSTRVLINNYFNINVFTDYFHYISITYYAALSCTIVFINNIIDTYNSISLPKVPNIRVSFNTIKRFQLNYLKLSFIKKSFTNIFLKEKDHIVLPLNSSIVDENSINLNDEGKKYTTLYQNKGNNVENTNKPSKNKTLRKSTKTSYLHDEYKLGESSKPKETKKKFMNYETEKSKGKKKDLSPSQA